MNWIECLKKVAENHGYHGDFGRLEWDSDRGGVELSVAYKEAAELLANESVKERLGEVVNQLSAYGEEALKIKPSGEISAANLQGQIICAMSMKAWVLLEIKQLQYPETTT